MSDHPTLTADQESALETRRTMFVVQHGRSPYPDELAAMTADTVAQTPAPTEDDPEAARAGEIAREEILAEREASRILAAHGDSRSTPNGGS